MLVSLFLGGEKKNINFSKKELKKENMTKHFI